MATFNTLFAALQNKELRELCSIFGYVSRLEELWHSVTSIKAILLDAEFKHQELSQLTNQEGIVDDWVDKLKDAVYDADDLFDEFTTIAQQLKGMPGGKISKKIENG
ncbi:disease resistance protein RGA2 [Spinacia oleracea]|uniref:Disease resistance protein RGA2 n=1 Tax=Spinacia oleracea TaxID=3562 RepID=A0A9R0KDI3_SPIOL|nr:disease resistance protein RGA2-like [Spinacia oleracea]